MGGLRVESRGRSKEKGEEGGMQRVTMMMNFWV
jgi:hypothetical protein